MPFAKYTVNEVEERSGVAATTLRQWERRYGFPKPERSSSGYRLYSDEDLKLIELMKRYIAEGIPASRAAELVKQDRLQATGPRPLSEMQKELYAALLALDELEAEKVLSEAYALHPVTAVLLELIQPAMVAIGQAWHDGKISTTTEHFASSYLLGRLRALLNIAADSRVGPSVIVACVPEEQHELGALMVAVVLRRAGYRVYFLGANTPLSDLKEMAQEVKPVAVLLSASTARPVQVLMDRRQHLEGMAPIVAFGGAAFNGKPELATALGGHFLGVNAEEALERLHKLIESLA